MRPNGFRAGTSWRIARKCGPEDRPPMIDSRRTNSLDPQLALERQLSRLFVSVSGGPARRSTGSAELGFNLQIAIRKSKFVDRAEDLNNRASRRSNGKQLGVRLPVCCELANAHLRPSVCASVRPERALAPDLSHRYADRWALIGALVAAWLTGWLAKYLAGYGRRRSRWIGNAVYALLSICRVQWDEGSASAVCSITRRAASPTFIESPPPPCVCECASAADLLSMA